MELCIAILFSSVVLTETIRKTRKILQLVSSEFALPQLPTKLFFGF